MFEIVFHRLPWLVRHRRPVDMRAFGRDARTTRQRVEVCPPTTGRTPVAAAPDGWRERLGDWIDAAWPGLLGVTRQACSSRVMAGAAPLAGVRQEFEQSLADINTAGRASLMHRIQLACTLHALWHLRPEIFNLVACARSESEAERRLALLNRHFPTRAPRSGFGALTSLGPDPRKP